MENFCQLCLRQVFFCSHSPNSLSDFLQIIIHKPSLSIVIGQLDDLSYTLIALGEKNDSRCIAE